MKRKKILYALEDKNQVAVFFTQNQITLLRLVFVLVYNFKVILITNVKR